MAEGVVDDISHEGLRALLREEGVILSSDQDLEASSDPDFEAKKNRISCTCTRWPTARRSREPGDPDVVICVDEFGPLNLQPHPGRQWAADRRQGQGTERRRGGGTRHLHPPARGAAPAGRLRPGQATGCYGHIKPRKSRGRVPGVLPLPALPATRPRCGSRSCCDNFSPHLSTAKDRRVGDWAAANNVELAYTPTNASWLNRIEAQFTALRYFALDGTDHASHREQASMIRRYIIWRNNHAYDQRLRRSHRTGQTLPDAALV